MGRGGRTRGTRLITSQGHAALDGVCPLCRGTGVLSPNQRRHWREFADSHKVETCDDCNEQRLVCSAE